MENTIRLQSVGLTQGYRADQIKKGDFLMWNFGEKTEVLSVENVSNKFISVSERSSSGYISKRRLKKDRIVCIIN